MTRLSRRNIARSLLTLSVLVVGALVPAGFGQQTTDAAKPPAQPDSPSSKPQFFDPPQFTVSGVTDTTALGGHGSDTVVRTRNSLARETAALAKTAAPTRADAERERDQAQGLLLQHPDDAKLHHRLADADEQLGDNLAAVREYQRAAELDPSEPNLFDWGAELLLHHAPEPAAEVFGKGSQLFPKSARMWIGFGAASFARGAIDDAVEKFRAASDVDPSDPNPYLFLGEIVSAETSPPPQISTLLQRFQTLQPENAEAKYYLALALWKTGTGPRDIAQIESLLNKSLALDPQFAPAYLQRGILQSERNDDRKAIASYERAIEVETAKNNSDSNTLVADAHYRLAQAWHRIGGEEKAKSELHLYQELAKKSVQDADRERREIRQFVYTLRNQPPAP